MTTVHYDLPNLLFNVQVVPGSGVDDVTITCEMMTFGFDQKWRSKFSLFPPLYLPPPTNLKLGKRLGEASGHYPLICPRRATDGYFLQ